MRRLRGLLGKRDLPSGYGVLLRPAWSIHTAFMRFPIDVVFLDPDQVVIKIVPNLTPFKTASCRGRARDRRASRRRVRASRPRARRPRRLGGAGCRRGAPAAVGASDVEPERRGAVVLASSDQRYLKLVRFLLDGKGIEVVATVPPQRRRRRGRRRGRGRRVIDTGRARRRPAPRQHHARAAAGDRGRARRRQPARAPAGRAPDVPEVGRHGPCRRRDRGRARARGSAKEHATGRRERDEEGESRDVAAAGPWLLHDERPHDTTGDPGLMPSLVRTEDGTARTTSTDRSALSAPSSGAARLEAAHHLLLSEADPRVHLFLRTAHRWALVAFEGAGKTEAADRLAAGTYVGERHRLARRRGRARHRRRQGRGRDAGGGPRRAPRRRALRPPPHGLLQPGPASSSRRSSRPRSSSGSCSSSGSPREASLWRQDGGNVEPLLTLGNGAGSRRARATAKAALRRGSTLSLLGPRTLRAGARPPLPDARRRGRRPRPRARRPGRRLPRGDRRRALDRSSSASSCSSAPRSASRCSSARASSASCGSASTSTTARSRTSSPSARRSRCCATRSTRSSSTAIASAPPAASTTCSRASPSSTGTSASSPARSSRAASSRARSARSSTARSTRSPSARASTTRLEIRGDPESLTSAQRIAVYRAIQESLSNVREHSGASTVEIRIRMRRSVDRGPRHGRRARLRGRAGARARRAARPARHRRDRGARAHARRHVRDRQRARRPDDAHVRAPARRAGRAPLLPLERAPSRARDAAPLLAIRHSRSWQRGVATATAGAFRGLPRPRRGSAVGIPLLRNPNLAKMREGAARQRLPPRPLPHPPLWGERRRVRTRYGLMLPSPVRHASPSFEYAEPRACEVRLAPGGRRGLAGGCRLGAAASFGAVRDDAPAEEILLGEPVAPRLLERLGIAEPPG